MEPITATVIVTYVATKFIDQFIAEEGYGRIRKFFFPKQTYRQELEKVIYTTIEEFEKTNPSNSLPGKFPFYHSQILFSHLIRLNYFKGFEAIDIDKQFNLNRNIIVPTRSELELFFRLFKKNLEENKRLEKLYIDENYRSQIFANSELLSNNSRKLNDLDKKVSEILSVSDSKEKPIVTTSYIKRDEEEKLREEIKFKNILLLTGISLCGKSQLAKKLCQYLNKEGFEFKSSSNISEAERYLRPIKTKRVFLLEDPFGHNAETESFGNWRKLVELIKNLPENNKLVVTSRIELIKSIGKTDKINECSIEGNEWHDLTTYDRNFLISCWQEMCKENRIDNSTELLIKSYLLDVSNDFDLLQPGQLNHLSNIPKDVFEGKEIDSLVHLARVDSKEISIEIEKRGELAYKLFALLGLGASINLAINFNELGYVLNESTERPGLLENERSTTYSAADIFSTRNEKPEFPQYKSSLNLSELIIKELGYLQKRGFIQILKNKIWFTHPIYREAARYLLINTTIQEIKILKNLIGKSISCLNPKTAINCANQFNFIYQNSSHSELNEVVRRNALNSVWYSIFPGVRDVCFQFLLKIIDDIEDQSKEKILDRLEGMFTTDEIHWHDEMPFIDSKKIKLVSGYTGNINENEIPNILDKIDNREDIHTSEVWNLLIYIQKNDLNLFPSIEGVLKILNYDEVFIRNRISFMVLQKPFPNHKILDTIFGDDHPSIIFEAIKGAILGFPKYSKEDKELILPYINKAIEDPHVIMRANNLISTFGIDYGSESINWRSIAEEKKKPMWELWAVIFPKFLNNYPKGLEIRNTGRLLSTLRDSIKYISSNDGIIICKAYYNWINHLLNVKVLDEFELFLMDYLINVVDNINDSRFELFKKILSHQDTNFVTRSLADAIDNWDKLSGREKEFVISLLEKNRIDRRWLLAISITQNIVPNEIQELIFDERDYFEQELPYVVTNFNNQLLNDCLNVFCGHPQPLWWLGYHHKGTDKWYKILKWILMNEHPIGFEICLREMISSGVNGFSSFSREDGFEIWSYLCNNSDDKKRLAERLIYETADTTCSIYSTKKL